MYQQSFINKTFRCFLLLSTLFFLLCGINGCTAFSPVDQSEAEAIQFEFDTFLQDQFCSSFENELINLHYTLKNPSAYNIEKPAMASSPITLDYPKEAKESLLKTQKELQEFSKRHLTKDQQRIYRTLDKYLSQQIDLCDYPQFLNLLSYSTGLSSNLPLTLAEYAFYTEEDVKDYLSILPQVPSLLDQAYIWEQERTKKGYGMADFEMNHTIEQISNFLDNSNLLIDTFETRLEAIPNLSKDQKNSYIKNNRELVFNTLLPAFEQLKSDLTLLTKISTEGKGLCHYEDGLDYYQLLLNSMTLSDRSISTMITSLEKRLETITDRISLVIMENPDLYDVFLSVIEDNLLPEQTPEEMLAFLEEKIRNDYPALPNVTYRAEPIPKALENDTTAAYYLIPPYDSPEENRIYYGDSSTDNVSLFMVLAHEGYPGHLYHQNYLLEHGLSPVFYVMDMTGYKEGWAFYAEIDAVDYYDFGTYEEQYHDGLTELYRCNMEYSYCISSLADLYVNGEGYSKEELLSFTQSLGLDTQTGISLYEFAIEEPGTYLQYYIGYLEILHIRDSAQKKSGKSFDKLTFHEAFLDLGPCFYSDFSKYIAEEY